VASVVSAVLVINAVYPAIVRSGNSITRMAAKLDERIESQVKIVYATGELDDAGTWQDVDSDSYFDVTFWVKNIGVSRIIGIEETDIFYGIAGDFARIPHSTDAGGTYPQWSYSIENGDDWTSSVTVKFWIHYQSAEASDEYLVKVITPNGSYDELYFSY
jgi:flagellar protein FlaG